MKLLTALANLAAILSLSAGAYFFYNGVEKYSKTESAQLAKVQFDNYRELVNTISSNYQSDSAKASALLMLADFKNRCKDSIYIMRELFKNKWKEEADHDDNKKKSLKFLRDTLDRVAGNIDKECETATK